MSALDELGDRLRTAFDERNGAREATLSLSRGIIRTAANSIRAAHRGEFATAAEMLGGAGESVGLMRSRLQGFADIYGAGYVHDCQKEYTEAAIFLALVSSAKIPAPEDLLVEHAAYLNGMGEAVGELRRHTLDTMRRGELERAESVLAQMDDIYYLLATFDYPDALTGGLRRTTDSVRGIIEKTRGELTTALRQQELRDVLHETMRTLQANGSDG